MIIFLLLICVVYGHVPVCEIRELIRPIKSAKRMVETLEEKLFLLESRIDTATSFIPFLHERETELIYESPRTDIESQSPLDTSSSTVIKLIRNKNVGKFQDLLQSIFDVETVNEILSFLENQIIPSLLQQIDNLKGRFFSLQNHSLNILEYVERQLKTVLDTIADDRIRVKNDLQSLHKHRNTLENQLLKNKQLLREVSTQPVFPVLATRSENSATLERSNSGITDLDSSSVQRIQTILRRVQPSQKPYIFEYLEKKFIAQVEKQITDLDIQITDNARILTQLDTAQSQCLAIYHTMIADQVWFNKLP